MVTSKRRIETEKDRFGGFAEAESYVVEEQKEFSEDVLNVRSYAPTVEKTIEETPRQTVSIPKVTERHTQSAKPVRRNIQDVMPEILSEKRISEKKKETVAPVIYEKKLSPTAIRAIVIYMAVVLAIVAGIIATGVAVSSLSASIVGYETTISAQEETISSQREELALLGNGAVIAEKAEGLGMVEIEEGSVNKYTQLEIGGSTEDESGLFDNIRDWLNSVFGG